MAQTQTHTMFGVDVTPTQIVLDKTAQSWMKHAVCRDQTRGAISGVYVYPCERNEAGQLTKPGGMVATTGHALVHVELEHYEGPIALFRIDGKVFRKTEHVVVDFGDIDLEWPRWKDSSQPRNIRTFTTNEGRAVSVELLGDMFPDITQVIPDSWGVGTHGGFGFNPHVFEPIAKLYDANNQRARLRFSGNPLDPVVVEGRWPGHDAHVVRGLFMPVRVDDEKLDIFKSGKRKDSTAEKTQKQALKRMAQELDQVRELAKTEEQNLRRQREEFKQECERLRGELALAQDDLAAMEEELKSAHTNVRLSKEAC